MEMTNPIDCVFSVFNNTSPDIASSPFSWYTHAFNKQQQLDQCFRDGNDVLDWLNFKVEHKWWNYLWLLSMFFGKNDYVFQEQINSYF